MKRSDMLKIIYDTCCEPVPYHDDGGIQMMWRVEKILDAIEKAGMLPPTNTCRIVPDEVRGGFRHSQSERKWDEEV